MTIPTVGRVMLYSPSRTLQNSDFKYPQPGQPCAAIVSAVSDDGKTVHLSVFDGEANQHPHLDVPVIQDGEEPFPDGGYAFWMPYQLKQHAKNETQAQGQISGCLGSYLAPTEEQRLSGLRHNALQYATMNADGLSPAEVRAAAQEYFDWLKQ